MHSAPPTEATFPPPRELLSALWLFAMLNYLYADVLSLMDPILLPQWLAGNVEGIHVTRPFLLLSAAMMEVPIAMTVLARILPQAINRWSNIGAGLFKTAVVGASLAVGTPNMHYAFFASLEIACTVLIVFIAWRWRAPLG